MAHRVLAGAARAYSESEFRLTIGRSGPSCPALRVDVSQSAASIGSPTAHEVGCFVVRPRAARVGRDDPSGPRACVVPSAGEQSQYGSAYWVSGWPDLSAEWHPERNGKLTPNQVTFESDQAIWWKCPSGSDHEWIATPNSRTSGESRCPMCPRTRAFAARKGSPSRGGSAYWVSGWPKLVAEWHPTKNGGLRPEDLTFGSGKKVWWKCALGEDHEWVASPNNRSTGGSGCPFCAGRVVSITNNLERLHPDLARQWHPSRNGSLTPSGITAGATHKVWWKCPVAADHEWRVSPHARIRCEGECPFCLGRRVSFTNCLAATQPQLAAEWHPRKNPGLTSYDVVGASGRAIWWRCTFDASHEWRAQISNRANGGSGCPFCAGRRASREHCLARDRPDIAREWHPTRNHPLTPSTITPRTPRRVWWLCACGHEWFARVGDRVRRGVSCPVCAARQRRA